MYNTTSSCTQNIDHIPFSICCCCTYKKKQTHIHATKIEKKRKPTKKKNFTKIEFLIKTHAQIHIKIANPHKIKRHKITPYLPYFISVVSLAASIAYFLVMYVYVCVFIFFFSCCFFIAMQKLVGIL